MSKYTWVLHGFGLSACALLGEPNRDAEVEVASQEEATISPIETQEEQPSGPVSTISPTSPPSMWEEATTIVVEGGRVQSLD